MRKTRILSTGALLGGIIGAAIGYFSPTAQHFLAIIPIYAVLFCLLGTLVSAIFWMATRTQDEKESGRLRDEALRRQTSEASRGGPSILGGTAIMIASMAWLTMGLVGGRLYFYPAGMFFVGLIAFVRGIISGGTKVEQRS